MAEDTNRIVRDIISQTLNRPIGNDEHLARNQAPEWDSLKHVQVMFSLEDAFEVRFDEGELRSLDSIDAIVKAIERHQHKS